MHAPSIFGLVDCNPCAARAEAEHALAPYAHSHVVEQRRLHDDPLARCRCVEDQDGRARFSEC